MCQQEIEKYSTSDDDEHCVAAQSCDVAGHLLHPWRSNRIRQIVGVAKEENDCLIELGGVAFDNLLRVCPNARTKPAMTNSEIKIRISGLPTSPDRGLGVVLFARVTGFCFDLAIPASQKNAVPLA